MDVGIISDVHLESSRYSKTLGTGRVLLVAGDLVPAALVAAAAKRPELTPYYDAYHDFMRYATSRFDIVLQTDGNHEHDYGLFHLNANVLRSIGAEYSNLHYLDNESRVIDGVCFFGANLWTDFNRGDVASMAACHGYMPEYQTVHTDDEAGGTRLLRPQDTYAAHLHTLRRIKDHVEACREFGEKLVIMSHTGPSKRSTHRRFLGQYEINSAFTSDLEHLMGPHIPLWVHGHTHTSHDYEVAGTRVICNPRGYPNGFNPDFNPNLVVTV